MELPIYDDLSGVQPPSRYEVQDFDKEWKTVANVKHSSEKPKGGIINTVMFDTVISRKVRMVFAHNGRSKSGLTEIEVWE